MPKPVKILALAAPAALLLAGCNGEPEAPAETGEAEASGEVLEGSISDEMLPLDELRSQAPQADPEPEEAAGGGGSSSENAAPAPAEAADPEIQPVPGIEIAEPDAVEAEVAE